MAKRWIVLHGITRRGWGWARRKAGPSRSEALEGRRFPRDLDAERGRSTRPADKEKLRRRQISSRVFRLSSPTATSFSRVTGALPNKKEQILQPGTVEWVLDVTFYQSTKDAVILGPQPWIWPSRHLHTESISGRVILFPIHPNNNSHKTGAFPSA